MPAPTIFYIDVKNEAVEVTMLHEPIDGIPDETLSVAVTTKRDGNRHNQWRNQTKEITKASFILVH